MEKKSVVKKSKLKRPHYIALALLFITIGVIIGLSLKPKEVKDVYNIVSLNNERRVSMNILAINQDNQGVYSELATTLRPGNGLVLLNINDVLADYDSQYSARLAAKIASNYTKISLENMDIIYNIEANATTIEGSSAGSAMVISTISALQNRVLNPEVVITGSLKEDGTFGDVGAVSEKAKAARQSGASIMLVPQGSLRHELNYKQQRKCTDYESIEYCEITYTADLSTAGNNEIRVIEVATIDEALKYFYTDKN